jgi:O-antigen/teichoic acid export membrane protein
VLRDTALTMVGEVFVLAGGLLFYALMARYFGPNGVGEVALVKRGSGLLQPLVFLGVQTGLPRGIAIVRGDIRRTGATVAAGLFVLAVATAIASLALLSFAGPASALLLGDARYANLMVALVMTLISIIVYGAVRGLLFGMLRIPLANVIQVLAVALAPIVVVLIVHPDVTTSLISAAVATTVIAGLAALPLIVGPIRRLEIAALRSAVVELLRYSVPRMPGDVMMAALLSIGVLWAARSVDLRTAGYLSVSLSMLSAITAAFVPLSVVLLPRAAALIAGGRIDAIRPRTAELTRLTLLGSVFVSVQAIIFADTILRWWLGPAFVEGAPALRAVLAGVPFLALFFSLRGLIDAAAERPYHTYNLAAALLVTLLGDVIVSMLLPKSQLTVGIALSGSAGFAVLAALTVRILLRLYGVSVPLRTYWRVIAVNVVAAAAGIGLHRLTTGDSASGLAIVAAFEVIAGTAALGPFFAAALKRHLNPTPAVTS